VVRSLQVIREEEQQHECDSRKREKDDQQEARQEILPAHRTLFLLVTQRICKESSRMLPGSKPIKVSENYQDRENGSEGKTL
jgi:hypothetical protein